jgi:hypothetical protein
MLQTTEIERRFRIVEQAIGQAAQACSAERNVPGELRDCIHRLDKQSDLTRQILQSSDASKIRKAVDELEVLGERAKRVCSNVPQLTPQMKSAVHHMHGQLSELKQELRQESRH